MHAVRARDPGPFAGASVAVAGLLAPAAGAGTTPRRAARRARSVPLGRVVRFAARSRFRSADARRPGSQAMAVPRALARQRVARGRLAGRAARRAHRPRSRGRDTARLRPPPPRGRAQRARRAWARPRVARRHPRCWLRCETRAITPADVTSADRRYRRRHRLGEDDGRAQARRRDAARPLRHHRARRLLPRPGAPAARGARDDQLRPSVRAREHAARGPPARAARRPRGRRADLRLRDAHAAARDPAGRARAGDHRRGHPRVRRGRAARADGRQDLRRHRSGHPAHAAHPARPRAARPQLRSRSATSTTRPCGRCTSSTSSRASAGRT